MRIDLRAVCFGLLLLVLLCACERESSSPAPSPTATPKDSAGETTEEKRTAAHEAREVDGAAGSRGRPSSAEPTTPFHERIALAVIASAPVADPASSRARIEARERLGKLAELIDSPDENVLWGEHAASSGFDVSKCQVVEFEPMTWVQTVLSLFMFPGGHTTTVQGPLTIVELNAQFRDRLEPGEYPYPLWHSSDDWRSYCGTKSIVLIFQEERLQGALRRSGDAAPTARAWDGRWRWVDDSNRPQPRVAMFDDLFSPENPDVGELKRSYAPLAVELNRLGCVACHSPDNPSRARRLIPLGSPAQALAIKDSLPRLLAREGVPGDDPHAVTLFGPASTETRSALTKLARSFEESADHALAYEQARRAFR